MYTENKTCIYIWVIGNTIKLLISMLITYWLFISLLVLITQHNHTGSAWGQMSGYSSDAQKAQVMLVSRGIMLLQRVNDHLYRLMYVQPSALKHFCLFNYWWLMLPFTVVYPSYEKWRLPGCAWSRVLLLVVRFRLMKLWLICSHRSRIWLAVWFKCQIQLYVIGWF